MTVELYARRTLRGRRWFWRARACNGEIVCQGETNGYHNKSDAWSAITLVSRQLPQAIIREVA